MTADQREDHHLSSERLAAFLDDALDATERAAVEAHLADCPACRSEVVEVHRLLAERGTRPRVVMWTLGAAAVAALLWVGVPPSFETAPGLLREQSGSLDRLSPIEIISPVEGSVIRRDSLRFVWRPREPGALYSLTISDESGDIVWQVRTRDTLVTLPPHAPVQPRRVYYWFVDGLLDGAAVTTTEVVEFRVSR